MMPSTYDYDGLKFKRQRCVALKLREPELEPSQLAERLGLEENTVRVWIRRYARKHEPRMDPIGVAHANRK